MRWWWLGLLALAGCGGRTEVRALGEDVLVLELGGDHARLGDAVAATRRRAAPPQEAPPPAQQAAPQAVPAQPPEPAKAAAAEATRPVAEPARSEPAAVRTVTLAPGQTLYRIAATHLGDGQRWRELAAANGWSEDEIGRLPAGTTVRLPR
jgi:5'-nucleotidase